MERAVIKTEAEWLAARKGGIGSSETAALLGWSKWSSPWALWARKTGKVDELPGNAGEMIEWGHRHENAIAEKFREVTGRPILDPGDYAMEWNGVLFTTVERYQWKGELTDQNRGILELKCAWFDAFDEWRERVPVAYQIQIQQAMYCTNSPYASVAVLGNGYQFKYFHIERNEGFIEKMVAKVTEFWEKHVLADVPPPADGNEATAKAIAKVYPTIKTKRVDLEGEEWWGLHQKREQAAAQVKRWESEVDEASNRIRAAIADAEYGVLPDGSGYSFKKTAKGRQLRRCEKCPQD